MQAVWKVCGMLKGDTVQVLVPTVYDSNVGTNVLLQIVYLQFGGDPKVRGTDCT